MTPSPLSPVFTGLRAGLHLLVVVLALVVVVRTVADNSAPVGAVLALAALFLASYALGGFLSRRRRRTVTLSWLAALIAEWVALVVLQPDAAYLVFPLFFLTLHLLPGWRGPFAVALLTIAAVVALAMHRGWSVAGVLGPIIGALVAVLIGVGYRALAIESAERERLLADLVATQDRLVATERETAVLGERSRLARDLHDTVAQSLSSIQLLLHAAERADPCSAGIPHVRLARESAAASLVDARAFIRALSPPELSGDRGLAGALERLADTQWRSTGLTVRIQIPDRIELPMHIATALLRITQGAMANVVSHADATSAKIELTRGGGDLVLRIVDDGRGFDPEAVAARPTKGSADSFGLRAARERIDDLGGTMEVVSSDGQGCEIRVRVSDEGTIDLGEDVAS